MENAKKNAVRDAFLWKVLEQFEGLSRWVVDPLLADAWEDGKEAVFTVRLDDYELLRFRTFFDDEGARRKGWDQRLNLDVEWRGEVTPEALVLGWRGSEPDVDKGLDSIADYVEGECAKAAGHVVELLRDKLAAAMEPDFVRAGGMILSRAVSSPTRLKVPALIDPPFESAESFARAERVLEKEKAAYQSPPASVAPGMELLAIALGIFAEMQVMRPETVFAGFIEAARLISLRERQVAAFVQSALLDLYLVEKAFFEGPSWLRPARTRQGALMEGVLREKAGIFRRSRIGQEQRADQIVAAMEGYYRVVLSEGEKLKPEEVDERVKRAFGRTKLMVTKAVDGLRFSVQPNRARLERLFRRQRSLE